MNDKLKKALKIGAIALGVGAYTFLAFSVGACAARKGNEAKADEIGLRAMAKAPKCLPNLDNAGAGEAIPFGFSIDAVISGDTINHSGDGEIFVYDGLEEGYYYLGVTGGSNFLGYGKGNIQTFRDGYTQNATFPTGGLEWLSTTAGGERGSYFYYTPTNDKAFFVNINPRGEVPYLVFVDTLSVGAEDYISLPAKWAPLAMFGGSISNEGNILTNSEWVTGYEQSITLWGFLFRNQGVVYNRLRINLAWLGGSTAYAEVGYKDGNGTFVHGLDTQWVISSVQYAFNLTDTLNNNVDDLYSYKAGACGVDWQSNKVVYSLGLNWVNDKANTLEIIDPQYKTAHGTRYTYGGIGIGNNLSDLDFLKAYNDLTSSEIGAISNGDVFALLSSGFNSFLPILNISIIPGITFGLLLFLPIFAAIVVVIIKVIKK